jgi:hypothetical protein
MCALLTDNDATKCRSFHFGSVARKRFAPEVNGSPINVDRFERHFDKPTLAKTLEQSKVSVLRQSEKEMEKEREREREN